VLAGSLVAATSLSLAVVPAKCEGKVCALVTTKLEHPGENWSSYVTRAELTVVVDGKRYDPISIQYKYPSRDSFELGPGEKTEYGTIVDVPSGKPVVIEALFVMQQKFFWSHPAFVFASIAVPPSNQEPTSQNAATPIEIPPPPSRVHRRKRR
jgi:hypothetical protein